MSVIETYGTTTKICGSKYAVIVRYCYYPATFGGSISQLEPEFNEVLTVSVKIGNALIELETSQDWDAEMGEEILENRK